MAVVDAQSAHTRVWLILMLSRTQQLCLPVFSHKSTLPVGLLSRGSRALPPPALALALAASKLSPAAVSDPQPTAQHGRVRLLRRAIGRAPPTEDGGQNLQGMDPRKGM